VPAAAIQQAISLLPADSADLASFRFNPGALERLLPALAAAGIPR
jgi:hypothetical protein